MREKGSRQVQPGPNKATIANIQSSAKGLTNQGCQELPEEKSQIRHEKKPKISQILIKKKTGKDFDMQIIFTE